MKKFTSIILALAMLSAMMITMIPTASAAWDGSSVSASLVGSGTELDPYLVSSENDLAFVAHQVNTSVTTFSGEFFKLTTDLDLGGHLWTPIGENKSTGFFSGTFDGDGHTVYGLNVFTKPEDKNSLYGGLFGRVDSGVVKNVTVEGATVVSYKYGGAIVGNLTAKEDAAPAAVINCHAINCTVRGYQIGGVVGRSSQTSVTKGHMTITGCTATNITLDKLTAEDYPALSYDAKNHFVGGIVGAIGSTIVSGCFATQIKASLYATTFGGAGGIVGIFGADKVSGDVVNCGAVDVTLTAYPESFPEKSHLGGLIGKIAHVAVMSGDPNTEYSVFNCFVADVKITNPTGCPDNGIVAGLVNDTIFFNDVYYVAQSDLASYGTDIYFSDYPFMAVNSLAELSLDKLNKGNSTAVWVANPVAGYPTIDADAALANQPTFVDYYVELESASGETTTEAPEVTTEAPKAEETTKAPEETEAPKTEETEAPAADVTTEAPAQTDAPAATEPAAEKGCGGMIAGGVVIIALLGTAVVSKKRD